MSTRGRVLTLVICSLLSYVFGYAGYLFNKRFILANIDALPFQYVVSNGFGTGRWWAFVLSVVVGLFCLYYIEVRILRR